MYIDSSEVKQLIKEFIEILEDARKKHTRVSQQLKFEIKGLDDALRIIYRCENAEKSSMTKG